MGFLKLGQKYKNIFIGFLVQMKSLEFAFEINWPLGWIEQLVQSQACAKGEIAANIPIQEALMQWPFSYFAAFFSFPTLLQLLL